jgi:hypothetical protein
MTFNAATATSYKERRKGISFPSQLSCFSPKHDTDGESEACHSVPGMHLRIRRTVREGRAGIICSFLSWGTATVVRRRS